MMKHIVAAALLLVAGQALSAETVFGLPISEAFNVPECNKEKLGSMVMYESRFKVKSTCFQRSFGKEKDLAPIGTDVVTVVFPFGESPAIASSGEISVCVVNGKLEGAVFGTSGIDIQDQVLTALKQKYGDPTELSQEKQQNRMGATFDTFTAIWQRENLEVVFVSAANRLDHGVVTINTPIGSEFRKQWLDAANRDRRPL